MCQQAGISQPSVSVNRACHNLLLGLCAIAELRKKQKRLLMSVGLGQGGLNFAAKLACRFRQACALRAFCSILKLQAAAVLLVLT